MDTSIILKRNIHVIIRNQASYSRHASHAQKGGMFEFDETQAHKIKMSLSWFICIYHTQWTRKE